MLFKAKLKGFFVEKGPHSVLLARTSSPEAPMVVEEVRECALGDVDALAAAMTELQSKKSPSGYMQAVCGVFTPKRLVRRVTLEIKRLKDPAYFGEILSQQLRVEPDKYSAVVLNANNGSDFDIAKPAPQKEVVFGGMPNEEILQAQDELLEQGIYPDRLELGSLAVLGALVDYLGFIDDKTSTLVLEIGPDVTNSYIVSSSGIEASRPIPQGYESMVPLVQKELGLKDAESARKLFFSNTFDFTGMGPVLIKRLTKELQSSIGFYEVQTGQSVGLLYSLLLPQKLAWLDGAIAGAMGVRSLKIEPTEWLASRQVTLTDAVQAKMDPRWFGLFSLMTNYNLETAKATDNAVAEKKA
jgi:Tfp pilus assembly PilM family ATPase